LGCGWSSDPRRRPGSSPANFLLVIPAMLLASFIWERIGENARDIVRVLVRFWPLTLIALLFVLGLVRMLLEKS
jgi:hypothetical protein